MKSRRRTWILVALGAAITGDFFLVVLPAQNDAELFTTSSKTLLTEFRANISSPDVQIAPEATPPRLLYGEGATLARSRGEQNWRVSVVWPFPSQRGLFTPWRRECSFGFSAWDDETDGLWREFVARFNADPSYAALPDWCRRSMTGRTGHATRVVWRYAVHDGAFLLACGAFGGLGTVHTIGAARAIARRRRRGQCQVCGYDLAGLATQTCPECGNTPASSSRE